MQYGSSSSKLRTNMSKWSEGPTPARILEFRSDFDTYQVGRYAGESILSLAAVLPYPAVTVGQTG